MYKSLLEVFTTSVAAAAAAAIGAYTEKPSKIVASLTPADGRKSTHSVRVNDGIRIVFYTRYVRVSVSKI